ncbi:MAG: TIGR02147 family protein, partial [Bdellovibrionota bacterium]|nr:TIGR02147 family protein [Bdellovibrionota bacterium]
KNNFEGICDEFPEVSESSVKECLQTLVRFDLVEEKDGYYFATKEKIKAFYEFSSFAVRQYHKGIMHKAAQTLDDLPLEERYFLSHIFCIGEDQYQQIQEKMNTFFKELSLELRESRPERLDAVYSVGAQCFRLNRSKVVGK